MRILSLKLVGYLRFSHNNIELFNIAPTEKMQLVLGSNGSGKSSMLKEASPLPAVSSNYKKTGSKEIVIEHRGHIFTLISSFSPTQKHSFVIDGGDNLNQGGTAAVQKELVKQYFNLTTEIHELVTGVKTFTAMGPSDRRYWFTKLSDVDYTYAISVYNKLKDRYRDLTGAIKVAQARLVHETSRIMSLETVNHHKKEIEVFNTLVNDLLNSRPQAVNYSIDLRSKIEESNSNIKRLSKEAIANKSKFPNTGNYRSEIDIDNELMHHGSDVVSFSNKLLEITSEIESNMELQEVLSKNNMQSLAQIDTSIQLKLRDIAALKKQLKLPITFDNPRDAYSALETIRETLVGLFADIPDNDTGQYSRAKFSELSEKKRQIESTTKLQIEHRISSLRDELRHQEHLKTGEETECPSCKYKWHKGFVQFRYDTAKLELNKAVELQEKLSEELSNIDTYLNEANEYFKMFRSYLNMTTSWTILDPLWKYLSTTDLVGKDKRKLTLLIEMVMGDLITSSNVEQINTELTELEKMKSNTLITDNTSLKNVEATLEKLRNTYSDVYTKLQNSENRVNTLKKLKSAYKIVTANCDYIAKELTKLESYTSSLTEAMKRDAVNKMIQELKIEISCMESRLSDVYVRQGIINDLEKQVKELTEEAEVVNLMLKELSPTEGLIAKGMLGFIRLFVKQMNAFIKKIWLYPMEVFVCEVSAENDVDLDYKFAVRVNGATVNSSDDVSMTSNGMREIFDLAFRIVAMKYLDMSDGILVLDEFSRTMDDKHKKASFYAINNLISQSTISQVYVVSHFHDCYGSLRNAEVCVLCDANIVLPRGVDVNKHVIIQ